MDEHARDPRGYFVYRRVDNGPEGGRYVSKAYWERNPSTTAREWVKVEDDQDPDLLAIMHALHWAAKAEPEDVAEYIMDANVGIHRFYVKLMSGRER